MFLPFEIASSILCTACVNPVQPLGLLKDTLGHLNPFQTSFCSTAFNRALWLHFSPNRVNDVRSDDLRHYAQKIAGRR
jgi:hypothetical protein